MTLSEQDLNTLKRLVTVLYNATKSYRNSQITFNAKVETLHAADYGIDIVTPFPFSGIDPAILFRVNAKALRDVLVEFDKEIEFKPEENFLYIERESAKIKIPIQKVKIIPDMPVLEGILGLQCPGKQLCELLDYALMIELNLGYPDIQIELNKSQLRVFSTDGRCLVMAQQKLESDHPPDPYTILIGRHAAEVVQMVGSKLKDIIIFANENTLAFDLGNIRLYARPSSRKFPDYGGFMDFPYRNSYYIAPSNIKKALKILATVIEDEKGTTVIWRFSGDKLTLSVNDEQANNTIEITPITYDPAFGGSDETVKLGYAYLKKIFDIFHDTVMVKIHTDDGKPVQFECNNVRVTLAQKV
jgi:DNA polymerase III sliding clamp (beta) subunit (PCNA family)